jgi:hypothetical protein
VIVAAWLRSARLSLRGRSEDMGMFATRGKLSESVEHLKHGEVSKAIETQTVKIPAVFFLGCAIGAMVGSLGLEISGRKQLGNFVGQWVPTFLILGLYNKLTKIGEHGYESD